MKQSFIKKEEEEKPIVKEEEQTQDEDLEQDEEQEETAWWEADDIEIAGRGEKKWDTLEHNGVLFPPEYVPHGIPIFYKGIEFKMTPAVEEVATMFAVMRETVQYYQNSVFRQNFFSSWRKILDEEMPEHPIRDLQYCDFTAIYNDFCKKREEKKSKTSEEKKALKKEKEKAEEKFKYCLWDGRKEMVANFRIEPPGLFRGRGKHPKQGLLKKRIQPEDITINIGQGVKIPECPEGHSWKEVRHDNTVTWLANWGCLVTGTSKYVMMGASSSIKGKADMAKYDKARRLKEVIGNIRADYEKGWMSSDLEDRQLSVATYFIDRLALRVGNEKGEDEADTVGCCSLRYEHVEPIDDENYTLNFEFLGKDSIEYKNQVKVAPKVYELIKAFRRGKRPRNDLFDQINPAKLNKYLANYMENLSAKVFRTYNASVCLEEQLGKQQISPDASDADKMVLFNRANTEVAILCNHQKAVAKNHGPTMWKLGKKTEQFDGLIERLIKARDDMKAGKKFEEVAAEFYSEEDKIQWEWLNNYGTDEQKKEYQTYVDTRKINSSGTRSTKGSNGNSKKDARKRIKKENKKTRGKKPKNFDEDHKAIMERRQTTATTT
eukprot:Tbor_TRINITY_DN5162_c0_g1::TRINITY_DN5162_c0_g1_i4::g.26013::m.26013/K03163/TOP1; DNA topoisomerase I